MNGPGWRAGACVWCGNRNAAVSRDTIVCVRCGLYGAGWLSRKIGRRVEDFFIEYPLLADLPCVSEERRLRAAATEFLARRVALSVAKDAMRALARLAGVSAADGLALLEQEAQRLLARRRAA